MKEADFYALWQQIDEDDPFELAVKAGALAESPGLIFVAGYQACIQATFPELAKNLWHTFAVSEDRTPDSQRPGVELNNGEVTGFKTWIASVDCVDSLIVKVGSGVSAQYGAVDARGESVLLTTKPESRFLPDMSQGVAEFTGAKFSALKDSSGVSRFHEFEPYYIYLAFLGRLITLDMPVTEAAKQALAEQKAERNLKRLDAAVSEIMQQLSNLEISIGSNWDTDQRLFSMYSKGIQSRDH